jgi:hypothetical protein
MKPGPSPDEKLRPVRIGPIGWYISFDIFGLRPGVFEGADVRLEIIPFLL